MKASVLLIAVTITVPGCAVLSRECCTEVDQQSFVTTGGTYCTAKSIAIPDQGLTLSDVTQQVIREKVERLAPVSSRARKASANVLPLGEKPIENSVSAVAVNELTNGFDAFEEDLVKPESRFLSEEEFAVLAPDLRDCIRRCFEDPGFFDTSEQQQSMRLQSLANADFPKDKLNGLKEDIRTVVILGLLWNSETPVLELDRTVELYESEMISSSLSKRSSVVQKHQRDAIRSALMLQINANEIWPKKSFGKSLEAGSTFLNTLSNQSNKGLLGEAETKSGLSDDLILSRGLVERKLEAAASDFVMVSVRKSNGRRISAPLFLVENYSAGDILLSPGDHVELTSFYQTSLAIPNSDAATSHVLIAGPTVEPSLQEIQVLTATASSLEEFLKFNSNNVADVVVVRRIELSGDLHDYILPIPRPELYLDAAAASELFAKTQLYPGDQLHLEVLDITPMIRESRSASQLASRMALEAAAAQEAFEKRSWIGKKLTKHHEKKKAVCARISAHTELVTGIDSTQLTQLSENVYENIGLQLGMAP